MRKAVLTTGLIVFVLFAGWFVLDRGRNVEPDQQQRPPPDVTVITVRKSDLETTERLPGRTNAYRIAEIRPQVSGIVLERMFEEGADVEKGEQLYQLDPSAYQAELDSAEANLRNARARVHMLELRADRYERLLKTKAISQQDYDDAQAQLDQANASVAAAEAARQAAKLDLTYTRVYAPIKGQIGPSRVTVGALVTENQSSPMAVITQLDPIYVDITQSSARNLSLRGKIGGHKIDVTIESDSLGGEYPLEGKLEASDVLVDESTGSVQLRALFPNPEKLLLPGLFVTATLHLGHQQAILVPQQSVSRDAEGNARVWRVEDDNTVSPVTVKATRAIKDQWLITDGLTEGDRIVFEGFQRIEPGTKVTPVARGNR